MDFLDFILNPGVLNAIAGGMQAGSRISQGQQIADHGQALKQAAQFQADQLREQAGDAIATAQRRAWSEDRAARYLQSETLARAAASGGGASDPTVINIIAKQAEEGAYRQQVALYEGNSRARGLVRQAQAREFEGASQLASAQGAERASYLQAGTSLIGSLARDSSLYQRFGGGGPEGVTPPNPFFTDEAVTPPNPFFIE